MNSFLRHTAQDLHARYGGGIGEMEAVFPSRRSQLYFEGYLADLSAACTPKTTSIDEIFAQISGLSTAEHYHLTALLYKIYSNCRQTDESFDRFYMWGEILLNDFDSIDKYMADAQKLFYGLHYSKELSADFSFMSAEQQEMVQRFWQSFSPQKTSGVQSSFLSMWQSLWDVYRIFGDALLSQNLAYQGLMHRRAAEILKDKGYNFGSRRFVFIGLNALNECEKTLLHYLKRNGLADFYWDYDDYYVQDKIQEAGAFMRYNLEHFPPAAPLPADNFAAPKDIQIVAAPSDALQTKLLPQMLHEVRADLPLSALDRRTAIVLIDEGLLIPALYALPIKQNGEDGISAFNVTMGCPLRQTPVYGLVELLRQMHKNLRTSGDEPLFYHRDALAVLEHQYIRSLCADRAAQLRTSIVEHNRAYVNAAFFADLPAEIQDLFVPQPAPEEFCERLCRFFALAAAQELPQDTADNLLRSEYIACAAQEITKLRKAIQDNGLTLAPAAFMGLLCGALGSVKIPFEGSPVEGLQIMGILETRAIDFERLIVLSLNEDTFVFRSAAGSFIPYHLRRAFGLPVQEQYDALYGYYFYRLLQRASCVRLLYNCQTEGLHSGEMSRYLRQLLAENPHIPPPRSVQYRIGRCAAMPVSVAKTQEVMDILRQYLQGGKRALSASSLERFLGCPLKFYFADIARIKAPIGVAEDADGRMLGSIFHGAMEVLYQGFLQKKISEGALQDLTAHPEALETLALQQTAKVCFGSADPEAVSANGKLWLAAQVAHKYIAGVLRYDLRRLRSSPFVIAGLERPVSGTIEFGTGTGRHRAQLRGIVDRIDLAPDGAMIVADYKSGHFENKLLALSSIDALFGEAGGQRREIFQGLLYSFMLQGESPNARIEPAFYFLQNIYHPDFDHRITIEGAPVTDVKPLLPQFAEGLQGLLTRIFDPQEDFCQTPDPKTCLHCEFADICSRR